MWPFSKSKKGAAAWDGPWAVLQGERDGKLLFARVNQGAEPLIGDERFGHRVHVGAPFNAPRDNGMPENDEAEQLNAIEDALSARLEAEGKAAFVAVVTCDGVREFLYYTQDAEETRRQCTEIAGKVTTHKLQLCIEPDAEWTAYQSFFATAE